MPNHWSHQRIARRARQMGFDPDDGDLPTPDELYRDELEAERDVERERLERSRVEGRRPADDAPE